MSTRPPGGDLANFEALMLRHFEQQPFHNLDRIFPDEDFGSLLGGTCSDKTLSLLADAQEEGFEAHLHSGFIADEEVHRLLRVVIAGEVYFADIGMGWPSLKPYPATKAIDYSCYGMRFRTEVLPDHLRVFHSRFGKESLQLQINFTGKSEAEIRRDIDNRYAPGKVYPFSASPRFSVVKDDRFLFIRGTVLEIYTRDGSECIDLVELANIPATVRLLVPDWAGLGETLKG